MKSYYFNVSYHFSTYCGKNGSGYIVLEYKQPYPNRKELTKSIEESDTNICTIVFLNIQKMTREEFELWNE